MVKERITKSDISDTILTLIEATAQVVGTSSESERENAECQ